MTVFFIPNQEAIREKAEPGSWRRLFADSRFIRFFIYVFLANFMLDGPMFMFGIFVKSVAPNDPVGTLKWLWLIMLVPEIVIIALARLHPQADWGTHLMFAGLAAGGVKWVVCGMWEGNAAVLHGVMLIHSVYVVGSLVAMPLYADYLIPSEEMRSTGQGLATMIKPSLGGICSNSWPAFDDHLGGGATIVRWDRGVDSPLHRWFFVPKVTPIGGLITTLKQPIPPASVL